MAAAAFYFRWLFSTYCLLYTFGLNHQISQSVTEFYIYFFLKFKMAAFRHFGIVALSYWTTHEVSSFGRITMSNIMLKCRSDAQF